MDFATNSTGLDREEFYISVKGISPLITKIFVSQTLYCCLSDEGALIDLMIHAKFMHFVGVPNAGAISNHHNPLTTPPEIFGC